MHAAETIHVLNAHLSRRPKISTSGTIAAFSREASAQTPSPILVIANDNDPHARYTTTAADVIACAGFFVIGLTCAAVTALVVGPVEAVRRMRGAG